ncbi:Tn3 family transposase [Streptomyces sp. NRRL F-2580]|uniref:Tn3 family transposase n=1 Tax=Streptomyces sp. NRRL F-2580 TaxID=1463841 RepID=UPI000D13FDFA|nr:Tn3 family transposase [Streptomyces sp. NRRL F-2580]
MPSRDPELREKAVKFLDLMANGIIFSTTVDMTGTLRQTAAQGWELSPDDIAALSPHRKDNGCASATATPPPSTSRPAPRTARFAFQRTASDDALLQGSSQGKPKPCGARLRGVECSWATAEGREGQKGVRPVICTSSR